VLRPTSTQWAVMDVFGLQVAYQAGIFSVDDGPSTQGAGRRLTTSDGTAGFIFFTVSNDEHFTPRSFVNERLSVRPEQIDYKVMSDRFVIVSGVRGEDVYYTRCNFPSGAEGPIHCIYLAYDKREKWWWDTIVTRMSRTLR